MLSYFSVHSSTSQDRPSFLLAPNPFLVCSGQVPIHRHPPRRICIPWPFSLHADISNWACRSKKPTFRLSKLCSCSGERTRERARDFLPVLAREGGRDEKVGESPGLGTEGCVQTCLTPPSSLELFETFFVE